MGDLGLLTNQLYNMSVRADSLDSKGRLIPAVITDLHDRGYPVASRKEVNALDNLKARDMRFQEEYSARIEHWMLESGFYGKYYRKDPSEVNLYMAADTKGTDLEDAVMYTMPKAKIRTKEGIIPVSILGTPIDYDKKISQMMRATGKSRKVVETYARIHEKVHEDSEERMLRQATVNVEGITDYTVLLMLGDWVDTAKSASEKRLYEDMMEVAWHRVKMLESQGARIPSDMKRKRKQYLNNKYSKIIH